MVVFSWLLYPVFFITLIFLSVITATGIAAVYPTDWAQSIYKAGIEEVRRRRVNIAHLSQSESIAAGRLIGHEPAQLAADSTKGIINMISMLTADPNTDQLKAELQQRRVQLETLGLRFQIQLVARTPSFIVASYLWSVGRLAIPIWFAWNGFRWFLPRTIPFLSKQFRKYLTTMTIIGVLLGVVWAWLNYIVISQDPTFDWLATAGEVATFCTIVAIISPAVQLLWKIFTLQFGTPKQWSHKGIILGVCITTLCSTFFFLISSGLFVRWASILCGYLQELLQHTTISIWAGEFLILGFLAYLLRNAWTWISNPRITYSSRLSSLSGAILILSCMVASVCALGVSTYTTSVIIKTSMWILLGVSALTIIAWLVEWTRKYRDLRKSAVMIHQKGFRLWALIAWAALVLVLSALTPIFDHFPETSTIIWKICVITYEILTFIVIVTSIPGFVITAFYIKRVSRLHRDWEFMLALPHPYLDTKPHSVCPPQTART